MNSEIFLTGITTSGTPHLGNYIGAIRPGIALSTLENTKSFYFLADYHALIKCQNPKLVHQSTLEIAATWLALGLDPDRSIFYRQSDIKEIPELTWFLTCVTAKGLMNRAHAYKASVDENLSDGEDPDKAISMGLFNYPILMAADILIFKATKIPVGKDQIQHIEMARDIAARFNHIFEKEIFVLPQPIINESSSTLKGLDGRKMSKSYNNTIPLFAPEKTLQKIIMRIQTNSQDPNEPKNPKESILFELYQSFAEPEQIKDMQKKYEQGISWGLVKQELFELLNSVLAEPRKRYEELIANPKKVEQILQNGAIKARQYSSRYLEKIRKTVGIFPLAK